jgi:citrate lyase subunit beta/citryl-CoA lyase
MMWASEDLECARRPPQRNEDGSLPTYFSFARSACLLAAAAPASILSTCPSSTSATRPTSSARRGGSGHRPHRQGRDPSAQVSIINRLFVPSDEEIAEANALLAAAAEAFARGQAAFVYKGAMVDAPHINRARKIVARATAAASSGHG